MSFYCVVKDGRAYEGSQREIIAQIFDITLELHSERNQINVQCSWQNLEHFNYNYTMPYRLDLTTDLTEARENVTITLWKLLPEYGYRKYFRIN